MGLGALIIPSRLFLVRDFFYSLKTNKMKIAFRKKTHMSKDNLARLDQINNIIIEYHKQGFRLTLRQLYYQLVARDIIPNNTREYDKISVILTKGRMSGIVDWDAIEDRIRFPRLPYQVDDVKNAIDDTINNYRLDRQIDQDHYIELWVEKDALSNVLSVKTEHYHVRLMVNRGYSSCSAMYDSYNRIGRALMGDKKSVNIFYLGDHDPSGLDMVRDIKDRLVEFLSNSTPLMQYYSNQKGKIVKMGEGSLLEKIIEKKLNVKHIGLTTEQVELYNPPPNPAKVKDPRYDKYMAKYGDTSWEVDALNPMTLHEIIDNNILSLLDESKFLAKIDEEKDHKKEINKMIGLTDKAKDFKKLLKAGMKEAKTETEKALYKKIFLLANKSI